MSINKVSNPIEFLIEFAWASGADQFTVNNAKDELNKIRQELTALKENKSPYYGIGCIQVNNNGDLYCPRLQDNPYIENTIPVYANREELKKFLDNSR